MCSDTCVSVCAFKKQNKPPQICGDIHQRGQVRPNLIWWGPTNKNGQSQLVLWEKKGNYMSLRSKGKFYEVDLCREIRRSHGSFLDDAPHKWADWQAENVDACEEKQLQNGRGGQTHQRLYIHKNPCLVVIIIIIIKKSTCLNMNIISLLSHG